ncbi:MAG: carboxypeptidase regulatory-like domain-containing protein, partial [Planctomycetes bacterium]|nr:carboxypeptidase regulatory-like domain-containing protein [Planctomycetota bacterium]
VPIAREQGQVYVVWATAEDYEVERSADVILQPDETCWIDPLCLARWAEDRPGEYSLEVAVVDGRGRPVAGASVRIHRRSKHDELTFADRREALVDTSSDGRAVLRGSTLGEKRLEVRATAAGFRPLRTEFAIDVPGAHTRTLMLEPGLSIQGRARTIDGEPVEGLCLDVVAELGDDLRYAVRTQDDGSFVVRGLEERDYVLMTRDSRYSSFTRRVPAGTSEYDVVVKRCDDTRDGALHDGELHGIVRDAETGATIAVESLDVMARQVWPDERATEADVLLEAWKPWYVQLCVGPEDPERGRFAETGLEAGTWILSAEVEGYAPTYAGPFRLEGRELVDGLVLEVRRGAFLSGRVLDPSGRPVEGAWVGLFGDQSFTTAADDLSTLESTVAEKGIDWVQYCAHSTRTDEAGRYEFRALPGGLAFRLTAVHERWSAVAGERLELRDGEERGVPDMRFGVRRMGAPTGDRR